MQTTASWLDRFFAEYYRRRPVSATFIGVHQYDDQLPDLSAAGLSTTVSEMRALVHEIDAGRVAPASSDSEAIDRRLAYGYLVQQIWEHESAHFQRGNPCVYTGEAVFGMISLLLRDYAPLEQRVRAATARLTAIPDLLAAGRANISAAPRAWIERAINECTAADALFSDGAEVLRDRHGVGDPRFHSAAAVARRAFHEFREYLSETLLNDAHDVYACGHEPLEMLIRLGHVLDSDAEAIEQYARRRMSEALENLTEGAARLDSSRGWREQLDALADIHPTIEEYYSAYSREFDAAREFAIEHRLVTWPDYPIRFEPIPDWARTAAPNLYFLFYRAPAAFDRHVIQRYLVTPVEPDMPREARDQLLRAINTSQIRLNHVVHHAGLGHHVQNWHAYRADSRVGRIAAVDCALRIAMFCGGTMAEGWACYATDLMMEHGYTTPLEALSMHQHLLRMAGRAIADVNLHLGEFTLDDAIAFYRNEIGMTERASRTEAVRNSMYPGAALMYLVGADQIHTLRDDMRRIWGEAFGLRRFHDTFLAHGSIPVSLIARSMRGESVAV